MTNIELHRTARDTGEWLAELTPLEFSELTDPWLASITVDTRTRFQTIEGFGGAFTEAAAATAAKLGPEKRDEILRAYFDSVNGHGYSLCRTHINSCDFALGNYAHCETDGDFELKNFSIDRDRQALLPMIKDAMRIAEPGGGFKLFASP